MIYSGRPYATWRLEESGVWREDPANPGTLLRYLPPEEFAAVRQRELGLQTTRADRTDHVHPGLHPIEG